MKIGIQGELGAYSHIAANNLFKNAEIKETVWNHREWRNSKKTVKKYYV